MLGRAIVLVREDQLSLAIGRRGQNVRLASKLCGWDIEIMTREELDEQIDRAVGGFSQMEGVDEALAKKLVEQGYMSYDDLSVIEPDDLMEMGGLTAEQVDVIIQQAEEKALEAEQVAAEERRQQREQDDRKGDGSAAKELEAIEDARLTEMPAETPPIQPRKRQSQSIDETLRQQVARRRRDGAERRQARTRSRPSRA